MQRLRTSSLALVGLVTTLAVANVLVTLTAVADGDEVAEAPQAVPAGAALTGPDALAANPLGALNASLVVTQPGQPRVRLDNATDAVIAVRVRARTSHTSGSLSSRMGPMTFTYAPEVLTIEVQPGERVEWALATDGEQATFGGPLPSPDPGLGKRKAGTVQADRLQRVALTEVLPAGPAGTLTPEEFAALEIEPVLLDNQRINVGNFSSWTVELTTDGSTAPTVLIAAS